MRIVIGSDHAGYDLNGIPVTINDLFHLRIPGCLTEIKTRYGFYDFPFDKST